MIELILVVAGTLLIATAGRALRPVPQPVRVRDERRKR